MQLFNARTLSSSIDSWRTTPLVRAAVLGLAVIVATQAPGSRLSAQGTIAFVQVNSATPQSSSVASVAVKFTAAQTAGDLNVVVVGWNDATAQVQSVTDTVGNTYQRAVGPTIRAGSATQSIYYAANIGAAAANANTVTVTFTPGAAFPDIRIAEYRGLATSNPVDVVAGASGSGTSSNSGAAATTTANDLLVGANTVQTHATGPGTGFTQRIITSPDGDLLEDRTVTTTGSYSATAPMTSGWWVMQMVAFRAAGSGGGTDTQPPTAPGTPTLTVNSTSQISLAWAAATDNVGVTGYFVERCAGVGCSTFAQVASPTTTSFVDTGLTAGTSYSYRVRATDAAANLGPYSAVATATTQTAADTQPPTAPGTPTLTVNSSSQIALAWTAATDNVGVTGYFVERCAGVSCTTFAQIAAPTALSYTDSSVAASTTYSYRVRATDAAGNLGPYSGVATATTPAAATIAFVQYNAAVPQTASATVTVPFTAAQSAGDLNVVVVGWNDSNGQVVSVTDTKGNTYAPAVGPTVFGGFATQSIYYAPNIAAAAANGNSVTVTFNGAVPYADIRIAEYRGIAATSPVDGVAAAQGTSTSSSSGPLTTTSANDLLVAANIVLSHTSSAGTGFTSRGITNPDGDILEDQIVSVTGTYTATAPIAPSDKWIMQLVAFRAAGSTPDTQPPTAPGALLATAISGTEIDLAWGAATDNVGIAGYRIERCAGAACTTFAEIAAPANPGTTWADTGLTANTSYSYRVRAFDAAGNIGPYSNTSSAITPAPDTTPPSAPGPLSATAVSGTEIDLSWGAATDDVGVAGYRVERCTGTGCTAFNKIGTLVTGTSFVDNTLSPNTTYGYIIRAQDAAGNLGPYTTPAYATTLATNPNLVAAYAFTEGAGSTVSDLSGHGNNGTIANATWTASGKYGNALVFNGTNALVTIPDSASLHLTTGMTLEAWVYPTATSTAWRDVVYKANDNYYLEATTTTNGLPAAAGTFGSNNVSALGTTPLPLNTWTHIAETYDGTTVRLFVNGAQAGALAQTGNIATSTNPLTLGGDSIYGQYFQGTIDEVRVYNVALTPAQIQADMAATIDGSFPQVRLSSPTLTFPAQNTGTTSTPLPVTVTNIGGVPMTVTGVTITGLQSLDFAQTNNCTTAAIAPQASCTINVTFTPSTAGTRTATLSISDNAPGSPHSVALSGTGTGFSITPTVAVVVAGQTFQFTPSGGSTSVVWSVDSVVGGTAATGTISTTGLYTAPATPGTHIVTGTQSTQSASASVYIANNAGVFTHHNDNARTGQNLTEAILTPANVNSNTFGKLATFSTDGIAHASPLYVANVNVPGVGIRNVVYVSTEHDSVYAFDADAAAGAAPLWHVSFINPSAGITTVPNTDTGECCDIAPEIGITGTPVIDASSKTLYVVAKTKEGSSTYVQRLHALDIATGAEKFGGPVVIRASLPGSGVGSVSGTLSFDPLHENQRTALLLNNGIVYFGFGSHGDNEPYHGWLLGYNATTLQQVLAYSSTPNGEGGGIWQSGGGLVMDAAGNFFFATGDGTFDANASGTDYGDSFVRLSTSGTVLDYFTPHDESTLDLNNLDLDAGGMILLPDQPGAHPHLLVSAGKNGSVYLVDRDNMTHFHSTDQNPQTLVNVFPFGTPLPGNYSSPVYFNGTVYFAPVADVLQAFKLTNGLLSTTPTSTSPQAFAYPGGALSISANGTGNAILWAVQKNGTAAGTLRAYDATNISRELYNSDQAGTRDTLDVAAKFSIPLVVNGKVFVASTSKLTVFGLLP